MVDSSGNVHRCDDGHNHAAWVGKALNANGDFNGNLKTAVCDSGALNTGLFWGILGSFQDKKVINPNTNPTITSWESVGQFRNFSVRVPFPWDWKMG